MTSEELAELEAAVDAADDKEVEAWERLQAAQDAADRARVATDAGVDMAWDRRLLEAEAEEVEARERWEDAAAEANRVWDRWMAAEEAMQEAKG